MRERDRDYIDYVEARMPTLRKVARHLTADADRGDDLVQETITRLYLRWRQASQARNVDAYVHRIMVNLFLDERRRGWAKVVLGAVLPETPARATPSVETRLVVRAALAKVPPGQRAVLVLRFIADRSVDEVAEILQVAPGTVKSQTAIGLATLRRLLAAGTGSDAQRRITLESGT